MSNNWTEDQKNQIINHSMDLCTTVDDLRQVVILAISNDGTFSVIRKRRDDATGLELIGALQVLLRDELKVFDDCFVERDRPLEGE